MKKLIFASFLTAAAVFAQSTPAEMQTTKPAPVAKVKKHHKHNKKGAASATSTTSNATASEKTAPKK